MTDEKCRRLIGDCSRVSVIGLGKLGASMAAAFAERGLDVIGVDVNNESVSAINNGIAPVQETGLSDSIARNKNRIRATASHEEAVFKSDISFVIVPTPSDDRGALSLQYVKWAFEQLGKAIGRKSDYHNLVLTSTVLPGSTRQALLPILESESGKIAGRDFGLCYGPEFIALGSVIHDFLNPDFTLVGELDKKCGDDVAALYSRVMGPDVPCARMSLENAELTKIALNAYISTKITFANMIAEVCERIPGGDIDVVTDAIGLDKRIGRKCLTGSIGYGGPCFPRDNAALSFICRELGIEATLAETTDSMNRAIASRVTERLLPLLSEGATVAVLGLSYKPQSHIIEESQGVHIAEQIAKKGFRVVAFDPMSNKMELEELRRQIVVLDSLEECLQQAEAVLVTTPDQMFTKLTPDSFRNKAERVLVFDFWRILRSELEGQPNIRYIAVGTSDDDAENTERLNDLWSRKSEGTTSTWK